MPGTVCVGCKIPNGLVLQIFGSEEVHEPVMGGGSRLVKRAFVTDRIKLNGPAVAVGKVPRHEIRHGAGLTYGVDADLFAAWVAQNKGSDLLAKGRELVFTSVKPPDIEAQAKDRVTLKTGLEEIDPRNLPDEFKRTIATAVDA
jgi:hypothetical protein